MFSVTLNTSDLKAGIRSFKSDITKSADAGLKAASKPVPDIFRSNIDNQGAAANLNWPPVPQRWLRERVTFPVGAPIASQLAYTNQATPLRDTDQYYKSFKAQKLEKAQSRRGLPIYSPLDKAARLEFGLKTSDGPTNPIPRPVHYIVEQDVFNLTEAFVSEASK